MKKRHLLLFILIPLTTIVSAQIDTFDIGQFILPEVSRKSLDFRGNAGGTVSNFSSALNTGNNVGQNLFASLLYNNFESDQNHQRVTFGNYSISGQYQNAAFDLTGQAVQNQVANNLSVFLNRTNRNYYQKTRFYGTQANLSLNNSFESAEYNGNIRYYENRLSTVVSFPFTYGFGRIEPVTDAWHAVRILNDFDRLGLLSQAPEYNKIYELAETLSDLRYERIFENRLGRIQRISDLDKHIEGAGIVNERDVAYFTSLYDIYEFGLQTIRSSGERLTLGIGPEISLTHFIDSDNNSANLDYGMLVFADYVFNYPISQEWQLDIEASVQGKYLMDSDQNLSETFSARPELMIRTGYYPNTRTFFTADVSAGGVYSSNSILNDKFAFYSSLRGNIFYFFSQRTALSLNLQYDFSQSVVTSTLFPGIGFEGFRFSYSIQLNHALY
jgi:hypothetical protein